jgi:DNA primase
LSEHAPLQPLSDSQRESMEEAVSSYQAALTHPAAAYLRARGLDRATAATFRLGSVVDPEPGHERFRGFLALPYLDKDGQALSLRFRCIQEHDHRAFGHGKYMSMTDEPSRVFNIRGIHQADSTISVTEGEFDAITLSMAGLPAVAIPGATGWRSHHRRMLAGFNRVFVWGDPDDAGADFVRKVTQSLRSAKGVRLRDGDVNETYLAGGAEALHALINEGSV